MSYSVAASTQRDAIRDWILPRAPTYFVPFMVHLKYWTVFDWSLALGTRESIANEHLRSKKRPLLVAIPTNPLSGQFH